MSAVSRIAQLLVGHAGGSKPKPADPHAAKRKKLKAAKAAAVSVTGAPSGGRGHSKSPSGSVRESLQDAWDNHS